MAPDYGRKNPVLIGICRQLAIDERNRAFAGVGIRVCDVAMEGLAAANALFFLHPDALAEKSPQLILDIGAESSTLLIVAGGQVLFVGALLFGADKFTKAIAALAEGSANSTGTAGGTPRLDLSQFDSPLIGVNRQLEGEIRNSIEHWRAGERPEISGKAFARVWVCGGGAKLEGLAASLGRAYGCSGEAFGPAAGPGNLPDPQLAVALGLALQSLGSATIAISLCPEVIRWVRRRRQRFAYLLAAVIIFLSLTVIYMFKYSNDLKRSAREFTAQKENLEKCSELIPKLEEHSQLIQHHEKMLLPIIEKANRGGRFLKSIEVLAAAQTETDWFIYLADEFSFEEGKPKDDKTGAAPAPERAPAKGAAFPGAILTLDATEAAMPQLQATLVTGIEQVRSMVMAGHSPKAGGDILKPVKAIREHLNESAFFKAADVLPKPERIGREETIFLPWIEYLKGLADRKITGQYVSYMFRLPFAELDVNKPVVAPAAAKGAKPAAKPAAKAAPAPSEDD
jgi:hypothetical protein